MSLVTETLVFDEELGRGTHFLVLDTLESVSLKMEPAIAARGGYWPAG